MSRIYDELEITIGDAVIKTEDWDKVSIRFTGEEYNYEDIDEYSSDPMKLSELKSVIENAMNVKTEYSEKLAALTRGAIQTDEYNKMRQKHWAMEKKITQLEATILKLSAGEE